MRQKSLNSHSKNSIKTHPMYDVGRSAGVDFYKHFIKGMKNSEKRVENIVDLLNLTDYGKYQIKSNSSNSIVITVKKSPLMKICSRKTNGSHHWMCHWMSGLLSGIFSRSNEEWVFEMTECIKYNKTHCEFIGRIV